MSPDNDQLCTLHTVNSAPPGSDCLASCLSLARAGDHILLIEDGCYAAVPGSPGAVLLDRARKADITFHALEPDLQARGLSEVIPGLELASYEDFVELSCRLGRSVSWY